MKTPLHYATLYNLVQIIKILIAKGGKINDKDHLGNTPLHDAAKSDSNEVAQLLLDNKADISAVSHGGKISLSKTEEFNSYN